MRLLRITGSVAGRLASGIAVAATLALAITPPAEARPSGAAVALKVSRSRAPYFVFSGRAGTTVSRAVTVLNVGRRRAAVTLYGTDATTGETSGAVYRSPQEPRRDVGAWIRLARTRLILAPGQHQRVEFRVTIPRGALPGQHLGGIVAAPDEPQARLRRRRGHASFGVRVREQAIIAVEADLPGPRVRQLAITGVRIGAQAGAQTLRIGLASTGDDLTKGTGHVTVVDDRGKLRLDRRFSLDTFVPHTAINYPVPVGRALTPGRYDATVRIAWAGHSQTRSFHFAIRSGNAAQTFGARPTDPRQVAGQRTNPLPWIIGGVLAAAAALTAGYMLGARARRRPTSS